MQAASATHKAPNGLCPTVGGVGSGPARCACAAGSSCSTSYAACTAAHITSRQRRHAIRAVVARSGAQPPGADAGGLEDDGSGGRPATATHGKNPGRHHHKPFRFWIDFQALSSPLSAALIERALVEAGGVRTGGPPKADPATGARLSDGVYGYMHMDAWDLLYSVTAKAALAADVLRPGQMLAIIPGLLAVTRKTTLARSLRDMFGEAAWGIVPRSFKLPDELDEWSQWLAANPGSDTGYWMLKNNKQRGTGLRLVRTAEAFTSCFETVQRPDVGPNVRLYRWYLAQQYVTQPLLLMGRKFGIRVWVLVPDVQPFRLYMHRRGLVLLSSQRYELTAESILDNSSGDGSSRSSPYREGQASDVSPGHVTNYAQNENGDVWSLDQLRQHLGEQRYSQLWHGMCQSAAAAFASALPRCAEVFAAVSPPAHSCFQFFGLDFLVDVNGHPWLMEVNATPSMKVEHSVPVLERLIHQQKWPVVRDMVALLGICPQRFVEQAEGHGPDRSTPQYVEQELRRRGGFVPLLHLLPDVSASAMNSAASAEGLLRPIPWSRADKALRAWACMSKSYKTAVAAALQGTNG